MTERKLHLITVQYLHTRVRESLAEVGDDPADPGGVGLLGGRMLSLSGKRLVFESSLVEHLRESWSLENVEWSFLMSVIPMPVSDYLDIWSH